MLNESAKKRLLELISIEKQFKEEGLPLQSETIGEYLGRTGDTIRKDLSIISRRNKTGKADKAKHYENRNIGLEVKEILGIPEITKVCIVGLNSIGIHIMNLVKSWENIELTAIFDTNINRMERMDLPLQPYPAWEIPEMVSSSGIKTAILATDSKEAEKNAERLENGGIQSILNLTGYYLNPSEGIKINNLNLFTELLTLEI